MFVSCRFVWCLASLLSSIASFSEQYVKITSKTSYVKKRQSQQIGACRLKTSLKFITKSKRNQRTFFIFFCFFLFSVSKMCQNRQIRTKYNGILLIKVIKKTFFRSCFESFQCLDEKRKYYKDNNQALILGNFPHLTYPD